MLLQVEQSGTITDLTQNSTLHEYWYLIFLVSLLVILVIGASLNRRRRRRTDFIEQETDPTSQNQNVAPPVINTKIEPEENWEGWEMKSEKPEAKIKLSIEVESALTADNPITQPAIQQNKTKVNSDVLQVTPVNAPILLNEQTELKHIGYDPLIVTAQTEPYSFPCVLMAKPNTVITLPQNGRIGRQGYKDADFKNYLSSIFDTTFEISDDSVLLTNNGVAYSPDISLIDTKNNLNLFIDIEIDEPYEGTNDLANRRPLHYTGVDSIRNNAFIENGWTVVRLAEIQVHQNPRACCLYVAEIIAKVNPKFKVPISLLGVNKIKIIKQWSKEEAENMSREKYREEYLQIDSFGIVIEENAPMLVIRQPEVTKEIPEVKFNPNVLTNPKKVLEQQHDKDDRARKAGQQKWVRAQLQDPDCTPISGHGAVVGNIIKTSFDTVLDNNDDNLTINYKNEKYGFIDKLGRQRIPCIYDWVSGFENDVARVKSSGKWGVINKRGQNIIHCIYDEIDNFKLSVAKVGIKNIWGSARYGVVDKKGREIIEIKYKHLGINEHSGLLAKIWACNNLGSWNDKTHIAAIYIYKIDKLFTYDFIHDFKEGIAIAHKNGKYGGIDETGVTIIPFNYSGLRDFEKGYIAAEKNSKWGCIDKKCNVIIEFKYESIEPLLTGIFKVKFNGKYGCVNKSGTEYIKCNYESIDLFEIGSIKSSPSISGTVYNSNMKKKEEKKRYSDDIVIAKLNGKIEILHKTGIKINTYDFIQQFSSGLAVVKLNDNYGYIDENGKEVMSLIYSYAESFSGNLANVKYNNNWEKINKLGEIQKRQYKESGKDDLPF